MTLDEAVRWFKVALLGLVTSVITLLAMADHSHFASDREIHPAPATITHGAH